MSPTPYAGLVTRALALIVDAVVINVIAAVTGAVLGLIGSLLGVGDLGIVAAVTGGLLWLGWTALYFTAFWVVTGQTPGARLLGVRVVSESGGRVGIIRAVARCAVMMVALVPLGAGFITVLFDERRRGPHDMIAHTVVRWTRASAAVEAVAPTATVPTHAHVPAVVERPPVPRTAEPLAAPAEDPPAPPVF
jgi:uncharacterized RDD family membrane protein YckC